MISTERLDASLEAMERSKEMTAVSKNSERIILVTGATGRQGGAVYQHLQKKGFQLRALVRDPNSNQARQLMGNGQEVFQGSFDDPDSLMRAMDGVYGVFSVQPYSAKVSVRKVIESLESVSGEVDPIRWTGIGLS